MIFTTICFTYLAMTSLAAISIDIQLNNVSYWGHRCNELSAEKREQWSCDLGHSCHIDCAILPSCKRGAWIHRESSYFLFEDYGTNERQWVENDAGCSVLQMQDVSPHSLGVYECWCDAPHEKSFELVHCFYLKTAFYANITNNGETKRHNGSCYESPMVSKVEVSENDLIEVKCQANAKPIMNCSNSTETFRASHLQSPCKILCRIRLNERAVCIVNITLTVRISHTNIQSKLTTEIPHTEPRTQTSMEPSLKNTSEVEIGNPNPNGNLITFSFVVISFLIIVVVVLLGLLVSKNKGTIRNRGSFSTTLKSVCWKSPKYILTKCLKTQRENICTRFRNTFVFANDNSVLTSAGTMHQSSSAIVGPTVVSPYAVTDIIWDTEPSRHRNYLLNHQEIPVDDNLHQRTGASTFLNSSNEYVNTENVIYAYD
ncbi:hypothetical protein HOLleu_24698 [Holothuria leucospilota]|uniref:Ig-like domain-containing protein n=1 Tax=Holothuria leucospilota TaxID=206669 RepID=A0A9Q1BRI3_HOLLE|nr:hypothetical protein HOLleu_24698 [Holothuria leucospilota]